MQEPDHRYQGREGLAATGPKHCFGRMAAATMLRPRHGRRGAAHAGDAPGSRRVQERADCPPRVRRPPGAATAAADTRSARARLAAWSAVSLPSSHRSTAYLRSTASRHTPCGALQLTRLRGGDADDTDTGAPKRSSSVDNILSGLSAQSQKLAAGVSRIPSLLFNSTAGAKPAPASADAATTSPPPPSARAGAAGVGGGQGLLPSEEWQRMQMRKKKRKSWPVRQRLWASFCDTFHALAALEQAPGTLMKSKADDKVCVCVCVCVCGVCRR